MSARKSDALRATDVLDAIHESRARIEVLGIDESLFLRDDSIHMRIAADSLLMCALRVTEEAGKLSDRAKGQHPEVDWRGIAGMRTFLAHDYGHIDRKAVWNAIVYEFDGLERACREIVEQGSAEPEAWP